MAEPTQAGAAACLPRSSPHPAPTPAAAREPRPCSRHRWLHGPSVGWGPPRITPATPAARGLLAPGLMWAPCGAGRAARSWRGRGGRRGSRSATPSRYQPCCQQPCLFPACAAARKSPRALGFWLCRRCQRRGDRQWRGGRHGLWGWGAGHGWALRPPVPLWLWEPCCCAGGCVSWGRGALGRAATAAASARWEAAVRGLQPPLPCPACCPSLLSPQLRCRQAPAVLARPVPSWGVLRGPGRCRLGCRRGCGAGGVLIDNVWASRLAWEPSCGPGAGAASGGVNIAPAHEDVTRCAAREPTLRWGGPGGPALSPPG